MPASNLLTLRAMAYNNAWANHRLLSVCAGLSQGHDLREAAREVASVSRPKFDAGSCSKSMAR